MCFVWAMFTFSNLVQLHLTCVQDVHSEMDATRRRGDFRSVQTYTHVRAAPTECRPTAGAKDGRGQGMYNGGSTHSLVILRERWGGGEGEWGMR